MISSEVNRDVTGDPQPDPSATVPAFQGMSLEQNGARHDLQTHRQRRDANPAKENDHASALSITSDSHNRNVVCGVDRDGDTHPWE
jgi:hypothetical protein